MDLDFLNSKPQAFPASEVPDFDHASAERFFNRELSWLAFNERVLAEASNDRHPLLEQLRFLSISGTNLDEFYTVRVAGLHGLARAGVSTHSTDGLTPIEQLDKVETRARALMEGQQHRWNSLLGELAEAGIHIVDGQNLSKAELAWLEKTFAEQVQPLLTPMAIDSAHPFPFIPNLGFALVLKLKARTGRKRLDALVTIPTQIPRFMRIPNFSAETSERLCFISLENIILLSLNKIFPHHEATGSGVFRVLRDSDIEIEEEAEDLVREFETALKRRRRGDIIRMTISSDTPPALKKRIVKQIGAGRHEIVELDGLIGIGDIDQLITDERLDLQWTPHVPRAPERIRDHNGDIFSAIREKDILLHHPYETFEAVAQFVDQAAQDANVLAIKQTLYRTSRESPIVAALCEAAESGKSVTALIELKARFDEAANIQLARKLERAGVQVVFGFVDWKVHAKLSVVVRREGSKLTTYTHYGTGNYHPITAKIYTDLSLFSCDPALARDAGRLFNFVTGYAQPECTEKIAIAPIGLGQRLLDHIEAEINHAKQGSGGMIWAKLNSIIEPKIIDALYRASQAGVQIDLIIRGVCGLRPGVPGLSQNIRVKSIIGRFLEHSRIACFGNGAPLPSKKAIVFISSADWMDRNLNRRVETLVQIDNETVKTQILHQIMAANLRDEANSWILTPEGNYRHWSTFARKKASQSETAFSCHDFFMRHPSLSGRGHAGQQYIPPTLIEDKEKPSHPEADQTANIDAPKGKSTDRQSVARPITSVKATPGTVRRMAPANNLVRSPDTGMRAKRDD